MEVELWPPILVVNPFSVTVLRESSVVLDVCAKLFVSSMTCVSLVCLLSVGAVTCVEFVLLGNVEPHTADCITEEVVSSPAVSRPVLVWGGGLEKKG